ncbi:MAG: tetratricopeptide repeat protein, partial [Phycisphaerales bacterium]|nr:tetratricopeptide repeat protein [Hyphomonadaceae bacterium]
MDTDQVLSAAEQALARGDVDAGEREITAAWPDISAAPAEARHILGAIRGVQGKLAEGEQLIRSAIADEPQSLRHRIALGHLYAGGDAHGPAAEAYAEALRIDPAWAGLRLSYAIALYKAGRHAEAETAARQAAQEAPSGEAWDTLSCALRAQGKHADALKAAEAALALRPELM